MREHPTFVVPYDFSLRSQAALFAAADLGREHAAHLHLLHVLQAPSLGYLGPYAPVATPSPTGLEDARAGVEEALANVADSAAGYPGSVDLHVVEGTSVAPMLCELARSLDADLMIMGTHGRSGLAHFLRGSVVERTLRDAPCAVLAIPDQEGEGVDAEREALAHAAMEPGSPERAPSAADPEQEMERTLARRREAERYVMAAEDALRAARDELDGLMLREDNLRNAATAPSH